MTPHSSSNNQRLRLSIAQEAARILAEEGTRDYQAAKLKAAERLGITERGYLPRNSEIESALIAYQRLFKTAVQPNELLQIRQTSLKLMDLLAAYRPHIVGPVLRGTANRHSVIELHLFSDVPEEIAFFLLDQHIPYQTAERRWQVGGQTCCYPAFRFQSGDYATELTIFPIDGGRQAPRCPVEQRPMQRADRDKLAALLDAQSSEADGNAIGLGEPLIR